MAARQGTLREATPHRFNEPQYTPLLTLSVRLASVINCNTRHAGQIEYLRGLVKYKGWFSPSEK
jgi:hypothetical protein